VSTFRFDVLTLFPGLFAGLQSESLLGKAIAAGLLELHLHDWRAFAGGRHQVVDDAPFGGGAGMVLKPDPVVACLRDLAPRRPVGARTVLLSPAGVTFDQKKAQTWAETPGLVLLCGRYEGFDARVEAYVDEVVSIGDYVLNGGEVAAMAVIEAVARLLPGMVGNASSLQEESHGDGLLEYPHYTRPREFEGLPVPAVLLGGNHATIAKWRRQQALLRTRTRRPELLARVALSKQDAAFLAAQPPMAPAEMPVLSSPDPDAHAREQAVPYLEQGGPEQGGQEADGPPRH